MEKVTSDVLLAFTYGTVTVTSKYLALIKAIRRLSIFLVYKIGINIELRNNVVQPQMSEQSKAIHFHQLRARSPTQTINQLTKDFKITWAPEMYIKSTLSGPPSRAWLSEGGIGKDCEDVDEIKGDVSFGINAGQRVRREQYLCRRW